MADSNTQLHWTDEQWNKVRQVVYEEARKARVAGNLLPLYGPLEPDADYVREQRIGQRRIEQQVFPAGGPRRAPDVLSVDDTRPLRLSTLQVEVVLRSAQVADPELASALIAFRRAANMLARLEDDIIFRGQPAEDRVPAPVVSIAPAVAQVRGGEATPGLLPVTGRRLPPPRLPFQLWRVLLGEVAPTPRRVQLVGFGLGPGQELVKAVSGAIGQLEEGLHFGPFACVLDQQYFLDVQTPTSNSPVLPQDQILPFLGGGALMRSSSLPQTTGLVIALGGAPIDLVVATDISVTFLQVTTDPFFIFRVHEKIVLRIKQPDAIAVLL